ncbi:DNA repair protein RecO [Pseudoclavibacter endophyticus]|uniref:DNA repair protein RecO n=1 Tax=Pseudoclavibacter endophyticus TaxID=1778590 RepID=A0A6H9WG70_9MICO|nr:DNA repair protein RecO [Pseudoclavibacter endophyticus]KAB1649949.1 DNA repair protein RecO [Pseudoclavibacter endophyticus]GGA58468.1 DNA repair protein RecO [Pseudoclavibacter endophyticus]
MPTYREEAVVLRTQRLGEADRIVTLLGRERGVVRAVAKGVRRTSSKFGARLEPFMVVDLQLFEGRQREGRSLDTVTQAVTISPYGADIAADWDAYAAASSMVEAAERLADAADSTHAAEQQYVLLAGSLRVLSRGERRSDGVRDAYLLRALSLAGWRPNFAACARCGTAGGFERVSLAAGGAVCDACAREAGPTIAVSVDAMRVLWALLAGNWGVVEAAGSADRDRASTVVAAYAQFHLERGLRSLHVTDAERRSTLHEPMRSDEV